MNSDFLWNALGGGAILSALITATLTLARLLVDSGLRTRERRIEQAERRQRQDRDAEARLERILQDRLADADRRLERADAELRAERVRAATLEHDLLRVQQAYELLRVECASLLRDEEAQRFPQ
ncbi:MAG: hypothetical protein JO352_39625 [Chloroflexi bacterium]|nr:hypothetical protein [Chloroflexota bacterium]